ncbi:hypothetical protein CCYA_CCYA15G3926 [Cyanidiococcus yangmingshanensis]|uniref:Charged multivesicular body protein n=1 Tax=Cyanidiococcus yangmingshanensis TaxID=2690220 RepID=A0A7J7IC53_9RHOD|nr:Charged multivesicular body protein [Cyanidiococcus yangmingshanensis]KAK4533069.1 hypothetical protein CCYA_CCYA15G3926 [Cyanidiococcus yangmingshanensis]
MGGALSGMQKIERKVFDMRLTAKRLGRLALKHHRLAEQEKERTRKALASGNLEAARTHAESSIRNSKQSNAYLKLQARMDAVASRIESSENLRMATGNITSVSSHLSRAVERMDLEEIALRLAEFERVMEDLDVRSSYVDETMRSIADVGAPREEVDRLIQRVADEHGLELADALASPGLTALDTARVRRADEERRKQRQLDEEERTRLEARFAKLSAPAP